MDKDILTLRLPTRLHNMIRAQASRNLRSVNAEIYAMLQSVIDPCTEDGEEWRALPKYEGCYEVSSKGRIRSLPRIIVDKNGISRAYQGAYLNPHLNSTGYLCTHLGRSNPILVHTLIAAAFLGERPKGMHICHGDGDQLNNTPENLRYDTPKNNQADRKKHGTHQCGEKCHLAKLTETQVAEIKVLLKGILRHVDIAQQYGVTRAAITAIATGINWKHVN